MYNKGEYIEKYLRPGELLAYIAILEKKAEQIEKHIRNIAKAKLGENVDIPDMNELIYILHKGE